MLRFTVALTLALGVACLSGRDKPSSVDDPPDSNGARFEGDDAGECNDGADNDRDGDFDCDDADCQTSPACVAAEDVVYDTDVDMLLMMDWGDERCFGSFDLNVDGETGQASGELTCPFDGEFPALSGPVTGTVDGARFSLEWRASNNFVELVLPIDGDVSGSRIYGEFNQDGVVGASGTLDGQAR